MSTPTLETLLVLIAGHALADYPLQTDFIAKGKNHRAPIPGIDWPIILLAHALIHGLTVYALTGSAALLVLESVLHTVIDWTKCEGLTTFRVDQALHVACKVVYVLAGASLWWL